jgi:hypothetical protein
MQIIFSLICSLAIVDYFYGVVNNVTNHPLGDGTTQSIHKQKAATLMGDGVT